jgi:hypothetical protein
MESFIKELVNNLTRALVGGWTSPAIKEVVIREAKRIGKKVIKAAIFFGLWRRLEKEMEKCYKEIVQTNRELGLPDDDYDPRDLERFMAQ